MSGSAKLWAQEDETDAFALRDGPEGSEDKYYDMVCPLKGKCAGILQCGVEEAWRPLRDGA